MSHKQAKRARKDIPTLHPQFIREGKRLKEEIVPQRPRAPLINQQRTAARVKLASLMAAYGARTPNGTAGGDVYEQGIPEDKGKLNGACNRSACLARPATWWNKSTLAHYCETCAKSINEYCPDSKSLYNAPLCEPVV